MILLLELDTLHGVALFSFISFCFTNILANNLQVSSMHSYATTTTGEESSAKAPQSDTREASIAYRYSYWAISFALFRSHGTHCICLFHERMSGRVGDSVATRRKEETSEFCERK